MRHLSIALVLIAAMVCNLIADLNFPDGSDLSDNWNNGAGAIMLGSIVLFIASILSDILDDD